MVNTDFQINLTKQSEYDNTYQLLNGKVIQ